MDIKTTLSAETYIKNSIEKFERMFGEEIHTQKYSTKEASHPESDDSVNMIGDNQSVVLNTTNVADVLTKPLGGIVHRRLIEPILCGNGVPELFKDLQVGK
jgi:hypothetical protein